MFASGDSGSLVADQDTQKNLCSFEQENITAVADRIACSMTNKVRALDIVGIFQDSGENSYLVQTDLDKTQIE